MYVAEPTVCPFCKYEASSSHHLFVSTLECGGCGGFFLAPISQAFRDLKMESITMGRAAEILGMSLMAVRETFNAWDAHFYPRDEAERAAADEWRRRVADGNLNIEDNIE